MTSSLLQVEGEPFTVDAQTRESLNVAMTRLRTELRFRLWPLIDYPGEKVAIRGVIGTISLRDGRIIEIIPKTAPSDDWISAILNLVITSDRIDAAGERMAGLAPERRSILPVLAAIYAARLERAFRTDGPIMLLRREKHLSATLKGKLDSTQWLRHALDRPQLFPASSNVLTVDNDFARGLSIVAGALAPRSASLRVRTRLLSMQRAMRPGLPLQTNVAAGTELRPLPIQWAAYKPAWDLASSFLAKRSLLGPSGHRQGISIAIEAWPLLERLLERSLTAACQLRASTSPPISVPQKPYSRMLLKAMPGIGQSSRFVEPDACLAKNGTVFAVFDAKYKKREAAEWPSRNDIYQVLSTACAFRAPLAILVYPEKFSPVWWTVQGMNTGSMNLAAIGLGLFSYKAGEGDVERGRAILDLLSSSALTTVGAGAINI